MESRRCPKCGAIWHSAYTGAWGCERCGAVMLPKNRVEVSA